MSKSRVIGFISAFILICIGLILRFGTPETIWGFHAIAIFLISVEGAWLVNILATRFMGKIYDDMKPIEIGGGIIGVKWLSRIEFIINIFIVTIIVISLTNKDCDIYSITGTLSCAFMMNETISIGKLYVGNKYAIIQDCLVKLDDIESVTKSEVTKKSNVSRTEFKVRTKKGKFYIVSCDKRKEDNIEELSRRVVTQMQ